MMQKLSANLAQEGKYLIFSLGSEDYGVEILKVREIIGFMEPVSVPQVPAYVKGVINLRGKVIPVVDLRQKFALPEVARTSETCIVIVNIDSILLGVIIDKVREVLEIARENIEPTPTFGANVATEFILGMGKAGSSIKILLNIEKIFDIDIQVAKNIAKA